jgi:hypothetical protein
VSITWKDGVTLTVEVAFATAPLADTPTYTDVSAYVRRISTNRGRSTEFDTFSPGTLQITFDNRDRRFDPEYSSGSYYGNLLPMKKVRVTVAKGAASAAIFTGFILGWPQEYQYPREATVTVTAVDGTRFLENTPLASSAYATEVLADDPVAYFPMQEATADGNLIDIVSSQELTQAGPTSGFPTAAVTFTELDEPVGAPNAMGSVYDPPGEPDSQITAYASTFSADPTIAEIKCVEMWITASVGHDVSVIASSASQDYLGVIVEHAGIQPVYSDVSENARFNFTGTVLRAPVDVGRHSHVAVYVDSGSMIVRVNGAEVFSETLDTGVDTSPADYASVRISIEVSPEWPAPTPALAHVALYDTVPATARLDAHYFAGLHAWGHPTGERSGARIGRVLDAAGWPSADRALSTGDTVHGPFLPATQTALAYIRSVESAEQGLAFISAGGDFVLRDRNWQWTQTSSATFSDDNTENLYANIGIDANTVDNLRNIVDVAYSTGTIQATDASSITAHGRVLESVAAPSVTSVPVAQGLAAYKLRTSKDPQSRVTNLTVYPRVDPADLFPIVIETELGDLFTVERTPQGIGSAIVKTVTVQGIAHDVTPDNWVTEYYLSPALESYTAAPYLTLGDATYGKIGAADGNLIPF